MSRHKSDKETRMTVLITGATGDIGRATALRFARAGWDIIGHYFSSEDKARGLKKTLEKEKARATLLRADFSSEEELQGFIRKVERLRIDALINNAGTYTVNKHFTGLEAEELRDTFMVNSFAPILLSARLFNGMKERGFGRIVNISSVAAKFGGSSHSMHYGCSKLALEGITKTIGREGAEHNVLVNTIRPGVIDTDFHRKFPKDMTKRIALIPMKRMGLPQDIAETAYYLGSEMNNYITRTTVTVAGGE